MSNEAQAMQTRKPGRPKAGSEDKKARILAEAALDAWVDMVAHNQRHPDGVALYTAMSAAVIDAQHQAHPWFRQHLLGAIEYLVNAIEHGKERGEVRADAPSEQIARKLVALSDGLQVQWLCSRANGGREFNMHEVMAGVVDDVKVRWLIRS